MNGKKAGRLQFIWIAFMTGVYTLRYSLGVIYGSYFKNPQRPYVDKMMLHWGQKLLGLIKVRVKVSGEQNIPLTGERPVIIMCNHSSLYDIPISAVALNKSMRMMAKRELFKIPIFSTALRRGEFISIDRQRRSQSLKDLKRAKEKMLDGIILWVAPEGTRSTDGKLAPFKRGAFHVALETGALIVPLAIKDIHKVQAGKDLTLYLDQDIEVEFCQPIDAANYSVETRKDLISAVRERMQQALTTTQAVPAENTHASHQETNNE